MSMKPGDPRNGHRYRVAVATCIANSDLCGLCGHHGARTADHIIPVDEWLRRYGTYDGVNDQTNLQPAHGTKGPINNPCHQCRAAGRNGMCNQSKGARLIVVVSPRSRDW